MKQTVLKGCVPALVMAFGLAACTESALEPAAGNWEKAAAAVGPAVYCLGYLEDGYLVEIGTGFAINDTTIMTNAHVVLGITDYLTFYSDTLHLVAVANGGNLATGQGVFPLNAFAVHPGFNDTSEIESFDFGIVTTIGRMPSTVRFETDANIRKLAAGAPVATLGFPGELEIMNEIHPVATFKEGTISAMRTFDGSPGAAGTRFYIQHNLALSPGTSGSPIFNLDGKIVAINNSGHQIYVCTDMYDCVGIPGSLGFGIRADQSGPALTAPKTLFADIEYDPYYDDYEDYAIRNMILKRRFN